MEKDYALILLDSITQVVEAKTLSNNNGTIIEAVIIENYDQDNGNYKIEYNGNRLLAFAAVNNNQKYEIQDKVYVSKQLESGSSTYLILGKKVTPDTLPIKVADPFADYIRFERAQKITSFPFIWEFANAKQADIITIGLDSILNIDDEHDGKFSIEFILTNEKNSNYKYYLTQNDFLGSLGFSEQIVRYGKIDISNIGLVKRLQINLIDNSDLVLVSSDDSFVELGRIIQTGMEDTVYIYSNDEIYSYDTFNGVSDNKTKQLELQYTYKSNNSNTYMSLTSINAFDEDGNLTIPNCIIEWERRSLIDKTTWNPITFGNNQASLELDLLPEAEEEEVRAKITRINLETQDVETLYSNILSFKNNITNYDLVQSASIQLEDNSNGYYPLWAPDGRYNIEKDSEFYRVRHADIKLDSHLSLSQLYDYITEIKWNYPEHFKLINSSPKLVFSNDILYSSAAVNCSSRVIANDYIRFYSQDKVQIKDPLELYVNIYNNATDPLILAGRSVFAIKLRYNATEQDTDYFELYYYRQGGTRWEVESWSNNKAVGDKDWHYYYFDFSDEGISALERLRLDLLNGKKKFVSTEDYVDVGFVGFFASITDAKNYLEPITLNQSGTLNEIQKERALKDALSVSYQIDKNKRVHIEGISQELSCNIAFKENYNSLTASRQIYFSPTFDDIDNNIFVYLTDTSSNKDVKILLPGQKVNVSVSFFDTDGSQIQADTNISLLSNRTQPGTYDATQQEYTAPADFTSEDYAETLKIELTTNKGKYIKYYPLSILLSNDIHENMDRYAFIGPDEIIYDNTGKNPKFRNIPFKFLIDDLDLKGEWSIESDLGVYQDAAPRVVEYGDVLLPANFYESGLGDEYLVTLNFKPEGSNDILFKQTIIIRRSLYFSPLIDNWDGNMKITDEGIVMSAALVAGTKDKNKKFTGVIAGEIAKVAGDNNNVQSSESGVFGYHEGVQSYAFKSDGTASIGKSGSGRINFDGNSAQIYSGDNAPSLDKKGIYTTSGMLIDLDESASGDLRSGGIHARNAAITPDGTLYAKEADIQGTISADDGDIGGWKISPNMISNEDYTIGLFTENNNHYFWAGRVKTTRSITTDVEVLLKFNRTDFKLVSSWPQTAYSAERTMNIDKYVSSGWTLTTITSVILNSWTNQDGYLAASITNDNKSIQFTYTVGTEQSATVITSANITVTFDEENFGNDTPAFKVDSTGKLQAENALIRGEILADNGTIGNWSIGEIKARDTNTKEWWSYTENQHYPGSIYSGIDEGSNYLVFLRVPQSDTGDVFSVRKKLDDTANKINNYETVFQIQKNGTITAKEANIYSGIIGGWTLDETSLVNYGGTPSGGIYPNGFCLQVKTNNNNATNALAIGNVSKTSWNSANFRVTVDGDVYAANLSSKTIKMYCIKNDSNMGTDYLGKDVGFNYLQSTDGYYEGLTGRIAVTHTGINILGAYSNLYFKNGILVGVGTA